MARDKFHHAVRHNTLAQWIIEERLIATNSDPHTIETRTVAILQEPDWPTLDTCLIDKIGDTHRRACHLCMVAQGAIITKNQNTHLGRYVAKIAPTRA